MQKFVASWFRYSWAGLLGSIALSSPFLGGAAFANNSLSGNIFVNSNVHEDIYKNTFSNSSSTFLTQNPSISPSILLAPDNLVAQSSPLTTQEIQNRLVGQWEMSGVFFVPVTVVFDAQGQGFILVPFFGPSGNNPPTAYQFSYQIRNPGQPMQIDIAEPGEPPIQTIFEFTSDGRIRVEAQGIKPGEPRPTEFTTGALFLRRVSSLTAMPRNTQIANSLEVTLRGRELQGGSLIGSALRAQQAYFIEKETFSVTLEDLGLGLESLNLEDYTYQLVPGSNPSREVFVTATARTPGIRSFSGVVFTVSPVNEGEENFPMTGICESIEPSMIPPALPTLNGREVQCATGSRVFRDDVSPFPLRF